MNYATKPGTPLLIERDNLTKIDLQPFRLGSFPHLIKVFAYEFQIKRKVSQFVTEEKTGQPINETKDRILLHYCRTHPKQSQA
jgi:hypothetical protein